MAKIKLKEFAADSLSAAICHWEPQGTTKEENQQVIVTQAATKYISVGAGRVLANLGGIFWSKNQGKAGHFHHGLTLPYRCSDTRRLSLSLGSIELCSTSLS